jgi:hypothetical protein
LTIALLYCSMDEIPTHSTAEERGLHLEGGRHFGLEVLAMRTTSQRLRADAEPRGELASRTLAMPADTNPTGDIFGGWIMALMDGAV